MVTSPTWLQRPESISYVGESELPLYLQFTRWFGHQRWIPKGQDRVLRLLDKLRGEKHFFFEVDFFGQRYRGDLAHFIDWTVFCYGSASSSELTLLQTCVEKIRSRRQSTILFLDIGANTGHHTLFMAPIVDRIIAFEPFPPLRMQIQERLELNQISNVTLMPFGLGDKNLTLDYYPGQGSNSGSGTFLPDDQKKQINPTKLEIRNGDQVLHGLKTDRVDLMKVDVEGFEAGVIRGLANRIQRDQPIILMELSEESKRQFGSEEAFRESLYSGASVTSVINCEGHRFKLRQFKFEREFDEILITPQGMDWLLAELR